ncbi:probable FAB1 - phosphatidylinositol 3-phosphate 5-kinase [Melanopsichium pennsylvanicum]|uniref:1-phosphatidylinositol-3-phosphate 5-kinase n=2 Tax=Melanopsichium pennsylvanicum TaxID=63383 RepID=A0AAJ4XGW0_9BASI|nr:probable FAB1-phosphatidylinositol 3-phosphate 5-kinase [Melanopsichium pennsylvanicum 4]SNX81918.1 probable FAB1 - phosphatidylinositol 3-phosphate 5-kinase [Melanopsichium pennsylvanicum]
MTTTAGHRSPIPNLNDDGFTSFGFLDDSQNTHDSSFALGSLLSRVKSAFASGLTAEYELSQGTANDSLDTPSASRQSSGTYSARSSSRQTHQSPVPDPSQTTPSTSHNALQNLNSTSNRLASMPQYRKVSMARPARGLSNIDEYPESSQSNRRTTSSSSRSGLGEAGPSRSRKDTLSPIRASQSPRDASRAQSSQAFRYGGLRSSHSAASVSTSRSIPSVASNAGTLSSRGLPLMLRSVAPAPAVTFTSPATAINARSHIAGVAGSYTDDRESVIADDGDMDLDCSSDTLLLLRGGIDGAIDRSHLAKYGWSAIPGFPLSKDILADDAKSIRSSSTRLHRVDTIEDQMSSRSAAQVGLQTSADAIVRRIRGEGLSRKFWMADENAKDCRECLSVFTSFRRKHHCRICGQIFCGRCAAHIIKGKRFNFEGMIRVCNFCKRMLEEYDRHERESQHHQKLNVVVQRASKNPNRVQPDKDMISAPLEAQIRSPQAQFAANHLFASASAGPSSFSAMGSSTSASFGFADTDSAAGMEAHNRLESVYKDDAVEAVRKRKPDTAPVAPFRKGMDEEELAPARPDPEDDEAAASQHTQSSAIGLAHHTPSHQTPDTNSVATTAAVSPSVPAVAARPAAASIRSKDGTSGVAFPTSATAHEFPSAIQSTSDYPRLRLVSETSRPVTRSRMRSLRTIASLDPNQASALIRSHFHGNARTESPIPPPQLPHEDKDPAKDDNETTEFYRELRICSEGITPALLEASITHRALEHLRKMMEQTLTQSGIHNVRKWCDVLLPFVLTTVSRVKPDAREDQSRDIREFVKIKRIPGGKPDDSEYVDGYVCTKHVATKRMAALVPLTNARIIVIRFPLDYHRGPNQFMSLEPLIAQEHEFTRILVARIIALRPQIVVVEKTVSRTALELLEKEGIVVVWSVKADAIRAISRCTQADIITSIDRLALDPRVGRCRYFNVETFQHASWPGWRKSFMRFEGTPKQLGCTIVLRGADGTKLSRVKKILAMMVFVAYNLRLEEHVMADEGAAMETIYSDSSLLNGSHPCGTVEEGISNSAADELKRLIQESDLEQGDEASKELGRICDDKAFVLRSRACILRALSIYETTLITSSVCIQIPAPYTILQLKRVNDRLMQLLAHREADELQRILMDEGKLQDRAPTPPASITEIVDDAETNEQADEDVVTPTVHTQSTTLNTAPSTTPSISEEQNPFDSLASGDVTPKYETAGMRIHDTIVEEGEESSSDAAPSSPRDTTPRPDSTEQPKPAESEDPQREHQVEPSAMRRDASDATVMIETASPLISGPNTTTPTPRSSSPVRARTMINGTASVSIDPETNSPASADMSMGRSISAPVSEVPTRTTSPGPGSILSQISQSSTVTVGPGAGLTLTTTKQEAVPAFDLFQLLKAPSQIAKESEFAITVDRHRASLMEWGGYLDIQPDSVSPFNHKRIQIIVTRHCTVTPKPCEGPILASIEFYGEHDETLGEHIERLAANSAKGCATKGCGKNNVLHYNTFVHNRIRIQVVLERFVCPLPNEENRLLSWSYCKVCENATPVALVTAETWSFSFAKYLELYFYRHDHCKTQLCEHDFYRDQVRYFAYQNMAVRFHSEEVDDLFEVTMPHFRLFIDPEVQCNIKNEETAAFIRKNQVYWDSVMSRIRSLGNDACSEAAGINREKNRAVISEMIKRCELDRREVEALVAELYEFSPATDVLCLNQARRMLQERVVKWDIDIIDFEKNCIPSEKDIRRITTTHLKRLFSEKDPSEASRPEIASSIGPPAAEIEESSTDAAEGKAQPSKVDQEKSASVTSTSTLAAIDSAVEALALAGADLSVIPMLSDLVTHTVGTPMGEMPPNVAATNQQTSSKAQSGARGIEAPGQVSRSKTIPVQLNKAGRADAPKYRDGNFDDETDAADLSPVEVRPMISRRALSNPVTAPASPTYSKSRGAFDTVGFPRADESSCTESELVNSVTGLIRRFDSPRRGTTAAPASSYGLGPGTPGGIDTAASRAGVNGSIRRPSLRRGKTEEVVSTHAKELSRSRKASAVQDDELDSQVNSPTAATPTGRTSRLPRAKRTDSGASVATVGRRSGSATPIKGVAPPPPSSYRPPKGDGLKAGPRLIIGRSSASAAAAALAAATSAAAAGNRSQSGAYQSDGTGSSRNAGSAAGSRVPVARRSEHGPGTRSRVSTIAKHFDRISKEAERERERQHRLLLAQRAKRARPVAMTRAKVEVFSSVRDAVRDDESEPDTPAESGDDDGASAADDESDDDEDDESEEDVPADATSFGAKRGLALQPGRRGQGQPQDKQRKQSRSELAEKQVASAGHDGRDTAKKAALARKSQDRGEEQESTIKTRRGTTASTGAVGVEADLSASVTTAATAATAISSSQADDACTIASQETGRATNISPPAASELESDAQSIAASSLATTSNSNQLSLPSYLRSGFTSDSDTMPSLERSFLKTLSGFWAFRTGEMVPLEYPMLNSEHVFADSDIIFREDEPTSIVAFTLSSTQYKERLKGMRNENTPWVKEKEEAFMPGNVSINGSTDGWGIVDMDTNELEGTLKKEGRHFRCEFESGSTRLWCKILFAEQFDALRRTCGCDVSVVESLSRCFKWDSSGGKSGSAFLKTRDHRLVVKQLSRFEMDAFSKFAPQYFAYMSQCISRGRRTALAKIFGCFRIGFRSPQTGKSLKLDCYVMENLFYGVEGIRSYDLKGSTRNRYIQETGKEGEVLLDENLIETNHLNPIFIREHSKKLLRASLYNDSLFLADMNVMDYSLMVGVDRTTKQLVVGIIDFVRTYTWDKRVESFVKETALLGGAGKGEPTIITPPDYRMRFLAFIDKALLLMPDHWIEDWAL